ncbi:endonuclease/exonuclease/phosphatase family protein, partial [Mesorhizobium sp. M0488]|uniref:endonuclease/exonuclease/phosphatase family protein n=1 Tax=Mesorhizobium sp. M0488 TaxID=2956949 RepID=UPI00333A24E8
MVRIATFNVNGVNGRLPVLLKWLTATAYDIVCLQELKTSDEKFPAEAIRDQSVILLCVRWYLAYNLSLRDLEEMMAE